MIGGGKMAGDGRIRGLGFFRGVGLRGWGMRVGGGEDAVVWMGGSMCGRIVLVSVV
jgi:hypothetical protein